MNPFTDPESARMASIRLLNQQLSNQQFSNAAEVVSWMGAMQAQEYRMMRRAVGMRLKNASLETFKRAFDDGQIIRTHLFRTTWQLVAAEDVYWMLNLCRDKNVKAINWFLNPDEGGIDEDEYLRSNNMLIDVLSKERSLTVAQLTEHYVANGFKNSSHRISILMRRAEFDGIICNGCLTDKESTYSLLERKVPVKREITHDEALVLLARKYFRSHAPATLTDFVWWSGLTVGDCRKAVSFIQGELTEETYAGEVFYVHNTCRINGGGKDEVHLLPSFDEYLIGYKTRSIVLDPEYNSKAFTKFGVFFPVILYNGKVVGNWKASAKSVKCSFFKPEYTPGEEPVAEAVNKQNALKMP